MFSGIPWRALSLSALLLQSLSAVPAAAQSLGRNLDFGVLETGVLADGTELPDVTGDTLDPDSPPRPSRAQALPPPADFFDDPAAAPAKKAKRKAH